MRRFFSGGGQYSMRPAPAFGDAARPSASGRGERDDRSERQERDGGEDCESDACGGHCSFYRSRRGSRHPSGG